jgi:hypothetical protein
MGLRGGLRSDIALLPGRKRCACRWLPGSAGNGAIAPGLLPGIIELHDECRSHAEREIPIREGCKTQAVAEGELAVQFPSILSKPLPALALITVPGAVVGLSVRDPATDGALADVFLRPISGYQNITCRDYNASITLSIHRSLPRRSTNRPASKSTAGSARRWRRVPAHHATGAQTDFLSPVVTSLFRSVWWRGLRDPRHALLDKEGFK